MDPGTKCVLRAKLGRINYWKTHWKTKRFIISSMCGWLIKTSLPERKRNHCKRGSQSYRRQISFRRQSNCGSNVSRLYTQIASETSENRMQDVERFDCPTTGTDKHIAFPDQKRVVFYRLVQKSCCPTYKVCYARSDKLIHLDEKEPCS